MVKTQTPIPIIAPNNNEPPVEPSIEQPVKQANENTPLITQAQPTSIQQGGNKKNNKNISRKSNK